MLTFKPCHLANHRFALLSLLHLVSNSHDHCLKQDNKIFQWTALEVKGNIFIHLHILSGYRDLPDFHAIRHYHLEELALIPVVHTATRTHHFS